MAAYREAYVSENTGGNVFVSDGAAIIAVMENSQYALTGNALIGVTTQTEPTIGAPVRFGKTKADCKEYFRSDSGNADVVYDADGKALLLQCTKKEETPAATFNATGYDTGTLDGLTVGMTYAVNGGTPVTVEGTSVTFTDIALPFVITVVQPGDGVTTYDSDPQTIELTRPDAPTLEVTPIEKAGDKGSIRTTTAHQKSTDEVNWTDCDGEWTNLDSGTYYVRTKPNGTALASDAQMVFFKYDPQLNVTVSAATQKEQTVITAALAEDATNMVVFTLDGNEYWIDIENSRAELQLTLSTGSHALTAEYLGDNKYLSVTVQTSFTVACAHEWKTEWSKDGVNHWHDCTRCDEKNDEAAHTYGDVSYTWEQTRGAWKATAKRTCTVCEWVETETVNATGAKSKEPACTVNGETTYTATFTNPAFETQTKTVDDIAALDHVYDAVVTEPTCTEDGCTTHTCARCGDSYTDSETDALGHVWGDWEIVRTATPNEKGEKKRTCTRCGEAETAEIDALIITSSADGQTGSSLVVTVPYAKRGAIATTLTADEPVTYTSSNPKLLTVDENGNVQFMRLCIFCKSATITTVSADGSKVATCKVNIEIKWWQYIVWFFLGSLWF